MKHALLLALAVSLLAVPARADDEWAGRVEKELTRAEKDVRRLDHKQADTSLPLEARTKALDLRMVELAKRAGLTLTPQQLHGNKDESAQLSAVTQAVVNIKARMRKLKKFKVQQAKEKRDAKGKEGAAPDPQRDKQKRGSRPGRRFGKRLWRTYREDRNLTVLTTDAGRCDDIEVAAVVHFKGENTAVLDKPQVSMTFSSAQRTARFAGVSSVLVFAEDNCITVRVKRSVTPVANTVIEILVGKVDLATFAKIAWAKDLKFGIGKWKFEATGELRGCLLEIAILLKLPDPYAEAPETPVRR